MSTRLRPRRCRCSHRLRRCASPRRPARASSDENKKPAATARKQSKDKAEGRGHRSQPALHAADRRADEGRDRRGQGPSLRLEGRQGPRRQHPGPEGRQARAASRLADLMGAKVKGATKGGDVDFKQADGKTELSQQVLTLAGAGAPTSPRPSARRWTSCSTVSFEMEGEEEPTSRSRSSTFRRSARHRTPSEMSIEFDARHRDQGRSAGRAPGHRCHPRRVHEREAAPRRRRNFADPGQADR